MTREKATAWINDLAISTPINPMNLCSSEEKPIKVFDRNCVKPELKPQICTCCLAPLPADNNTCEYCCITYR